MKPFLKWAGGKRWFTNRFKKNIDVRYDRYIEPFLGSAAVYFHLQPCSAVLADKNKDLINAYECLKNDWPIVQSLLSDHQINHSKEHYYSIRGNLSGDNFTRAARFIYLNRTCFNGLYRENKFGKFNVPIGTKTSVLLPDDDFKAVSNLLSGAEIFCRDFDVSIDCARDGDLLFVDPPYTVKHNNNGFVRYNEKIFSWGDQVRLSLSIERAARRGVMVLMTNAYHHSVISLYEGFSSIVPMERASVLAGISDYRNKTHEALIAINLDLDQILDDLAIGRLHKTASLQNFGLRQSSAIE